MGGLSQLFRVVFTVTIILYAKATEKTRYCGDFSAETFTEYVRRLLPGWQEPHAPAPVLWLPP